MVRCRNAWAWFARSSGCCCTLFDLMRDRAGRAGWRGFLVVQLLGGVDGFAQGRADRNVEARSVARTETALSLTQPRSRMRRDQGTVLAGKDQTISTAANKRLGLGG